jgi:hypothetical protein
VWGGGGGGRNGHGVSYVNLQLLSKLLPLCSTSLGGSASIL